MTNPVIEAIEQRQTINYFDATLSISTEQIEELVRLATRAPSSFNLQNWRFIAVHSLEKKEQLKSFAWNQEKITDSSVTFIVVGQLADHTTLPARLEPTVDLGIMPEAVAAAWEGGAKKLYYAQPWRQRDEAVRSATFGAATMMFAAHSMGLGAAPMIGFDVEPIVEHFGIAANEVPVMLLGIGTPTTNNWPQKPRRPLNEVLEVV